MIVNIEGRFINTMRNQASFDIEWHHHTMAKDTFVVSFPHKPSFKYITAGEYRYMETGPNKVKRQLALHHLKEDIGDTPMRLDDLELLSNGQFLCKDPKEQSPKIFSTAFSNMWWSFSVDSLPQPQTATFRGARKETRVLEIKRWKKYSDQMLPSIVSVTGPNYSGDIWIRSAYPMEEFNSYETNPRLPVQKREDQPQNSLFGKVPAEGEREIPLIFKLNNELLR